MRKLLILIPAYNESKSIRRVIKSIPKNIPLIDFLQILIIDDGSSDETSSIIKNIKVKVIRHIINCGLGAAITTGFEYAKKQKFDYIITYDADGQHQGKDIIKFVTPLLSNQADVVIGSRQVNKENMPIIRRFINFLSNIYTYTLFHIWTTDSQSGFRGFNKKAIKSIKITSQRMEVSSEIIKEIGRNQLRLLEVPIQTIYTQYSLKKGQSLFNAPNVMWKLILNKFSHI